MPTGSTGPALAEALGLELQPTWVPGECRYYVEVEESGPGYCIDSVVSSRVEAWAVGQRLRGVVPSEQELRVAEVSSQIDEASEAGDWATVDALKAELDLLVEGGSTPG
jgi:hypothetical protein